MRPARPAVRIRRVTRSTSPTTTASSASGDRGERPSARCAPNERRRRRTRTGRGSRLWASAWRCRPAAGPSSETSAASPSAATWPTVASPSLVQLAPRSRGRRPRAARPAAGAGTPARRRPGPRAARRAWPPRSPPWPGTWCVATPTVIGRPTRSRTSRRRRTAISVGVPEIRRSPRTSRKASSIDSPSTSGAVSLEDVEHRPAGLDVGRPPRRHDHGLRAQPPRLAPRPSPRGRRRPWPRSSPPAPPRPDDDRPAAQAGIVALLDRREERVEVGVQDRRLPRHEHMFAHDSDGCQRHRPRRVDFAAARSSHRQGNEWRGDR